MEKLESAGAVDQEEQFRLAVESLFDEADKLLADNEPLEHNIQSDGNVTKQQNVELGSESGTGSGSNIEQHSVTNNKEGAICSMSMVNQIQMENITDNLAQKTGDDVNGIINCDGGRQEHTGMNHNLEALTHIIDDEKSIEISGDITSLVPPIVNVNNVHRDEQPNSNSQHSTGSVLPPPTVSQNHPPILLDYAEVRSSAGNNWSNNNNNNVINSSIINGENHVMMRNNIQRSVIPSTNNVQFQSPNHSNRTGTRPLSTIPILQTNQNQVVAAAQVNGIAHSFGRTNHHESNMIYSSHHQYQNVYPENVSPHQLGTIMNNNNQLVPNNMSTNYGNFVNGNNQYQQPQSSIYPPNSIFSPNTQMMNTTGGMGVVNQFNRQINNSAQQVIFTPQLVMNNIGANLSAVENNNPPGYNWGQQSQHPQMNNTQIPPMQYVVNYNPYGQNSSAASLRGGQNVSYHQQVQVPVPATQFDRVVINSTLHPNVQIVHHFNRRPIAQQEARNNEFRASSFNFTMPSSLSSSRTNLASQYSNVNVPPQVQPVQFGDTIIQPSNLSRVNLDNNQRQLQVNTTNNAMNSNHCRGGHSFFSRSQGTPNGGGVYGLTANSTNNTADHVLMNSQQGGVGVGIQSNGQATVIQNNNAASTQESEITSERRGRGRGRGRLTTKNPRDEIGESSTSSKRLKKEVGNEKEIAEVPNNDAADNSNQPANSSRDIINTAYDPSYEENGIAIDPHIRSFTSSSI
ncbi:uncharacterized protein LOC115696867 [Cannabis sativa]|uniref:uncharacterized protein LOC115696867 n=1 Tax=Cannabis sativa TaxID=3483 RepID=UPI0029CA2788|nr:uncharacterized protein LOC115696867 [Cannabis sativa]